MKDDSSRALNMSYEVHCYHLLQFIKLWSLTRQATDWGWLDGTPEIYGAVNPF